jgi:glycerol uptake facilitator-like aquaporin
MVRAMVRMVRGPSAREDDEITELAAMTQVTVVRGHKAIIRLSGAHFNPAVSLAFALRGELPWSIATVYIAAQIAGGIIGVWAAHLMFELPLWQLSITARTGPGQWLAEGVARQRFRRCYRAPHCLLQYRSARREGPLRA